MLGIVSVIEKEINRRGIPDGLKSGNTKPECAQLSIYAELDDEKILFYYFSSGSYNATVLTNKTFKKVEAKKIVSTVKLSDIKVVEREKNGIFSWDKIKITTKDGKVETFGISNGSVIDFYIEMITKLVK